MILSNNDLIKFINICKFTYNPLNKYNDFLIPKNYTLSTLIINNIIITVLQNKKELIISLEIINNNKYNTNIIKVPFKSYKKNINLGKVNHKYIQYYETIKQTFFDIIEKFTNTSENDKIISISGHSIGASVILLGFVDLNVSISRNNMIKINYIGFGCLKIGDFKFTSICNFFLDDVSIINNYKDIIIHFPSNCKNINNNKILYINKKDKIQSIANLLKIFQIKAKNKFILSENNEHSINKYMHLVYKLNNIVLLD